MAKADEEVILFVVPGILPNHAIFNGLQGQPIKTRNQCPRTIVTLYVLAVREAIRTRMAYFSPHCTTLEVTYTQLQLIHFLKLLEIKFHTFM